MQTMAENTAVRALSGQQFTNSENEINSCNLNCPVSHFTFSENINFIEVCHNAEFFADINKGH